MADRAYARRLGRGQARIAAKYGKVEPIHEVALQATIVLSVGKCAALPLTWERCAWALP
jgi:hypothetical protein